MCGWILSSRPSFCSEASGFNVLNCTKMVATSSYTWVTALEPSSCWPCSKLDDDILQIASPRVPVPSTIVWSISSEYYSGVAKDMEQQSHQETATLRVGGQGRKCQWSEVSNILQFLIPELATFVTFNWSHDHLTSFFSHLKLVPYPIIFLIVYEDKTHNYIIFIEHSMFLEININY